MLFKINFRLFVVDLLSGLRILSSLREIIEFSQLSVSELKDISQSGFDSINSFVKSDQVLNDFYMANPVRPKNKNHFSRLFKILSPKKTSCFLKKTSGSTGEPFKYYASYKSQSYLWAGIIYSWMITGYRLGDRVAILSGTALSGNKGYKKKIFNLLMNFKLFDVNRSVLTYKIDFIEWAQKNKVNYLYGYASLIYEVSKELESRDLFLKFNVIITTAEELTPAMRASIESRFLCKVFNQYGCNDAGLSAFECNEHSGFHYLSQRAYVKVIDGKLISTDNYNFSMPMLEYDTGDLAEISDEPCSCGLSYPLIKCLIGRQNEVIKLDSGEFHSSFFTNFFNDYSSVVRYQVIKKSLNLILLNIDSVDSSQLLASELVCRLGSLLGADISVVFTNSFYSRPNGKVPIVVNNLF